MTNSTFSIRRAIATDAPALWAIRADAIRRTCITHYPAAMLERWASNPIPEFFADNIEKEYCVVGVAEGKIAGFAELKIATAEVQAVFVAPDQGRRGLGRQLLTRLEEIASKASVKRLGLNASLNAVPFYRAAGYHAVSEGIYTTSAGVEIACVRMQKQIVSLQE